MKQKMILKYYFALFSVNSKWKPSLNTRCWLPVYLHFSKMSVRCHFPIFIIRLNYLPLRARFKSVFHSDYVTSNEIFKFPQKNWRKSQKKISLNSIFSLKIFQTPRLLFVITELQRRIQNPVKYLWWSILRKTVNNF